MLRPRYERQIEQILAETDVPVSPTRWVVKPSTSDVTIGVDRNKNVGYNSRFFVRHFINWWFTLIPHLLPRRFVSWLFTGTSDHIDQIVEYRTSWKALKLIYNWGRKDHQVPTAMLLNAPERNWRRFVAASFWETMVVYGAGTRNRMLQVKKLTRQQMAATVRTRPFYILSIGSGSSQAILEAVMAERNIDPDREIRLIALDMSREALTECVRLGAALNIPREMICTIRCKITRTEDVAKRIEGAEFDLIEVVGFSEYQEIPWLINLAQLLHDHLSPSGVLLFNNAQPNSESWFTREIMRWKLNLKKPETLAEIMLAAGFNPRLIEIIAEPTKTFWMAKATKEAS